jgi:excinuclease UvrABC ATPase subunit
MAADSLSLLCAPSTTEGHHRPPAAEPLICITGLSGSGKSSLAFDTIYAEGQRRYVESLSAYARQFLQMMEKPDVDHIDGLSPAISIDQKTTRATRSTVGTVTRSTTTCASFTRWAAAPPDLGMPIAGRASTRSSTRC